MRLAIHADTSVGCHRTVIALEINPMVALNAVSIHSLTLTLQLLNFDVFIEPETNIYFENRSLPISSFSLISYRFALRLCDRRHSGWS
uniref:Uncharacterized protein n=1 Tax=Physcomitrium patens TaxID=3218 RepID=A0A2K1IWA7_PHYPA|nr:hypothetical protein PHYPA_025498 [Physcomitrium patens]